MAKFASLDSLRAIRDWAKEKFQSKLPEVTTQDNGDVLSVVDGAWSKSTPEKELPEVTSADNGKVLAVVAGEWEKAEAPDGLPPVQSADNGKVLTVVEGEWAKADVPDELPEVSASDNGKFLGVVNGAWGKAEVNALPAVTSQDNGKVLGVVEGQWAKTEPEDGLPEVTSSDNGKVLSVVEGAWAPADGGGSQPFLATFTSESGSMEYSCDKTPEEIKAAADAGQVVMCDIPVYYARGYYACGVEHDDGGVTKAQVVFFGATYESSDFVVFELAYNANGIFLTTHPLP